MPARPALDPVQLVDLARRHGADVRAGHHPAIEYDPGTRWHRRVHRDAVHDVWLISWLPSQGTRLHDHGGSSGAFAVLDGRLDEAVHHSGVLAEHPRAADDAVGFGPHYVHDVRNLSDAPALSVHVYSPPLTSMTYYDVTDAGLTRVATLDTDDPEPDLDGRATHAGHRAAS